MPTIIDRLRAFFAPGDFWDEMRQVNRHLLWNETDRTLLVGADSLNQEGRDRYSYDRVETLELCLEAWRENPIARRIVNLTTQYVIGSGITVHARKSNVARFVGAFWNHQLNQIPTRLPQWCDELTRTGNLFLLISTDPGGMSYLRAIPATQIKEITHAPNDVEQPVAYLPKPSLEDPDPQPWPAFTNDFSGPQNGIYTPAMLHYTINRPVGSQWGESDLAPLLKWLSRYTNWLTDRVRLNHYRNAFIYVVKARFTSEAERLSRQQMLNARPPSPGSILVADSTEEWDVINPQFAAHEAERDGLTIKKMIAAGAGVPLHFLAEPESSTRSTAEAAGGPTFRHFEQRQTFFLWMITDILRVVINRRAAVDPRMAGISVSPAATEGENKLSDIQVLGTDISAKDNVSLSMSAVNVLHTFTDLRDRGLIDDAELLRIIYLFAGENTDIEEMLKRGEQAPPPKLPSKKSNGKPRPPIAGSDRVKIDPDTGEEKKTKSPWEL